MPREKLYDVLEECLVQLNQGVGLEDVLAQHQQLANELRPLLETALLAQPRHAQAPGLYTAQNRSRARFLGAASQRQPITFLRSLRLAGMRLSAAVALAVVVFTVSLVGSGLASAKSVPGQALYPVKRAVEQAQLALTTSQMNKIDLEQSFDQRRAQETEQLIQTGQTEKVQFAGFLYEDSQAGWVVDQSLLILTPDQVALAQSLDGAYVEVSGTVHGGEGVQVNQLQLRLFQVSGKLDSLQGNEWVVSGVHVRVLDSTHIMGNPRVGARVNISAVRQSDGQLVALTAKLNQGGSVKNSDEDQKTTDVNDDEGGKPEPKATVSSGDDDQHGGGKDKQNSDPTSTPEPDSDNETNHEDDSTNNTNSETRQNVEDPVTSLTSLQNDYSSAGISENASD